MMLTKDVLYRRLVIVRKWPGLEGFGSKVGLTPRNNSCEHLQGSTHWLELSGSRMKRKSQPRLGLDISEPN